LSTTVGASTLAGAGALGRGVVVGAGGVVVVAGVLGAVLVGGLALEAVVVGGAGVGVLEVSVGVVDGGGVVLVVSDCVLPASPSTELLGASALGVPVVVVVVAPSAEPASGPPRPAAVSPLPARAEMIARTARWRARFRVGIGGNRSCRGRPRFVVGATGPQRAGYAHRHSYRQRTTNP
jgi:hypothetical protein